MKRRDFLKALSGGLVTGAAVPLLPISAPPLEPHMVGTLGTVPLVETLWQRTARQYREGQFGMMDDGMWPGGAIREGQRENRPMLSIDDARELFMTSGDRGYVFTA